MARQKRNGSSIMKKMILPMLLILLIQAGLFMGIIFYGGTMEKLNRNSFTILNERVINRKNYIQNEMIQRWSNFGDSVSAVNSMVSQVLQQQGIGVDGIQGNSKVSKEILKQASQNLVYLLRRQSVTGAFLVLNGQDNPSQTFDCSKSGIYIRDLEALSSSQDNSDLMFERGPAAIPQALGITMDNNWMPQFQFSSALTEQSYDFFYKPFRAALQYPEMDYSDLGYWSRPFQLSKDDSSIITYSVPLICDGVPYGVLGIEVSLDFLNKLLPYEEIADNRAGSYLLAIDSDDDLCFENLLSSGSAFQQIFGEQGKLQFKPENMYQDSYQFANEGNGAKKLYGSIQYFNLYNSNTPFQADRWALIGVVDCNNLLGFSQKMQLSIYLAIGFSVLIGLIMIIILSRIVTKPITSLVKKVKESNPHFPVKFGKTEISEVDELATAVENLSYSVAESASKLSRIIEMSSVLIGAFECDHETGKTTYTRRLFDILGMKDDYENNGYISNEIFHKKITAVEEMYTLESEQDGIYILNFCQNHQEKKWVRLKLVEDEHKTLGVVEDITQQMLEKKKIEYERDYDLLTNLFNRRAFYSALIHLFSEPEQLKIGAMIMFDLDNLKYINDTYGHDYGDHYIRYIASILKKHSPKLSLLSRMSGDEFYLFIYGYENRDGVFSIIEDIKAAINKTVFPLPDAPSFRVRASAGIAWYPDDSSSYEQLIRYADFAMYTVKNTEKGGVRQFDIEEYRKDSYLLQNKEDLNKLIDQKLIEYYFQPIVAVATGEIFAYEALMRSKIETLKSPFEILTLARSQSMLYHIEKLTWFQAMQAFVDCVEDDLVPARCKIFINSIANQIMSVNDIVQFAKIYQQYLDRIVVELTEQEKQKDSFVKIKQEWALQWNVQIALDDFGSGYNGEAMLLSIKPHFVKIDMSIVRDIDIDKNRQEILKNLLSYAKEREIKVIAEGVETRTEMEALINYGVDYLQGFYIGMPNPVPQKIDQHILDEMAQIRSMR